MRRSDVDKSKEIAEKIADYLFTSAFRKTKADHLELTTGHRGSPEHFYLGGWSEKGVVDVILKFLDEANS
jgi:hypothetical protein